MSRISLPVADTPPGAYDPRRKVRYIRTVDQVANIPENQREALRPVTEKYVFRANDYYLSLIDWNDPNDPIRQLIIPREEELKEWGRLDASNEAAVTVAKGVQHKYPHTVLLLCNEVCGAYCRYCFRKRLFMDENDEVTNDVSEGIRYIASNPNVTNVLLTGGDPLLMSTRRIVEILKQLRAIPHVKIIRIGSKMPAFDPWRLTRDEELQNAFRTYSTPRARIYLMAHFDHPRELTDDAINGLDCFIRCGVICVNQCPLIRGINDDPKTLSDLYRTLSWIGVPPYYLFQCRPTAGNEPYSVPLTRGWEIFREALRHGSGLARRARYTMSHETGKVEILAVDERHIYLRYHRAKDAANRGRFMIYERNDQAHWLDDLKPAAADAPRFPSPEAFDASDGPD
ncbi:MAG: KamA family radical SAM protein [Phycisphaeraceae bacterium]|nr:KamA family radical SAM protein [Phycisphaerales bacterium]QOJ16501.1 MAG: KamA family radical SAM protein [Phycisphaeraceae bacterium]